MTATARADIVVYGRFSDYWSHTVVSCGIVEGLRAQHLTVEVADLSELEAGLVDTSAPALYVGGYPPHAPYEALRRHSKAAALFIAESSVLPDSWRLYADKLDRVFVPSSWVGWAYRDAGYQNVTRCCHGLDAEILAAGPKPKQIECPDPIRLLHICGAVDFQHRKGTPELCDAVSLVDGVELTIRVPPGTVGRYMSCIRPRVRVVETGFAMTRQQHITDMKSYDAVVQPSRAEAFGMVPLEARALGIPVVMTRCSGHTEHAYATDIFVRHGMPGWIQVNGIVNGQAPTVTVEAIVDAIKELKQFWIDTAAGAYWLAGVDRFRKQWTWKRATEPIARWAQGAPQKETKQ